MSNLETQILFAVAATGATLLTLIYVLAMAVKYSRVRGLLIAITLWLLSSAAGWASWLLQMVGGSIAPELPGQLMFGVMVMLLPLFAGVVYWIVQELAER